MVGRAHSGKVHRQGYNGSFDPVRSVDLRSMTMSAIRRILVAIKDLDGKHLTAVLKAA